MFIIDITGFVSGVVTRAPWLDGRPISHSQAVDIVHALHENAFGAFFPWTCHQVDVNAVLYSIYGEAYVTVNNGELADWADDLLSNTCDYITRCITDVLYRNAYTSREYEWYYEYVSNGIVYTRLDKRHVTQPPKRRTIFDYATASSVKPPAQNNPVERAVQALPKMAAPLPRVQLDLRIYRRQDNAYLSDQINQLMASTPNPCFELVIKHNNPVHYDEVYTMVRNSAYCFGRAPESVKIIQDFEPPDGLVIGNLIATSVAQKQVKDTKASIDQLRDNITELCRIRSTILNVGKLNTPGGPRAPSELHYRSIDAVAHDVLTTTVSPEYFHAVVFGDRKTAPTVNVFFGEDPKAYGEQAQMLLICIAGYIEANDPDELTRRVNVMGW